MIVHILLMCTGDAGPEQSLVLFTPEMTTSDIISFLCKFSFLQANDHLVPYAHVYLSRLFSPISNLAHFLQIVNKMII